MDIKKQLAQRSHAVEGSGIRSYLETSLLVTDLQSPDFTRGKWQSYPAWELFGA